MRGAPVIIANNDVTYVGTRVDIERLFKYIRELVPQCEIAGYRFKGNAVVFGRVDEPGQLALGLQHKIPQLSPKYWLLPPEHVLVHVDRDYSVKQPQLSLTPLVFFGVKPCDVAAIKVLDSILMAKHPVYTHMRGLLKLVIVEECLKPLDTCFCGDLGTGPLARDDYDIAYAMLGELVYFRAHSGVGVNVLRNLELRKPSEVELARYEEALRESIKSASGKIPDARTARDRLVSSAPEVYLWKRVSEKCLACGSCNYVCPTCFCTEIEDLVSNNDLSVRVAKWIGCRTYTYGLVAGGHFRPELYTRYRHFVLHKMVFYREQIGRVGCVGCGRCTAWCPVELDFKEALREVVVWKQ